MGVVDLSHVVRCHVLPSHAGNARRCAAKSTAIPPGTNVPCAWVAGGGRGSTSRLHIGIGADAHAGRPIDNDRHCNYGGRCFCNHNGEYHDFELSTTNRPCRQDRPAGNLFHSRKQSLSSIKSIDYRVGYLSRGITALTGLVSGP